MPKDNARPEQVAADRARLRARLSEGFAAMRQTRADPHVDAARAARRQVEGVLEGLTDAFFALDPQWRFIYLNRKAERIFGRSRGELLGRDAWEQFPQSAGTGFDREYRRAIAQGVAVAFEELDPALGGWFEIHAYPSATGLCVYFSDITHRRQAEQERLRAQAALSGWLELALKAEPEE